MRTVFRCEARNIADLKSTFSFIVLSFPVIERFCLPPDAKVTYKDATGTEVNAFSSSASSVILDEVYSKRHRNEDTRDAASAKQVS